MKNVDVSVLDVGEYFAAGKCDSCNQGSGVFQVHARSKTLLLCDECAEKMRDEFIRVIGRKDD